MTARPRILSSKTIKPLALLFITLVLGVVSRAQESLPDLVARIKPSVVTVVTYNNRDEVLGRASGFCVADGRILTNYHVIKGAARITITLVNGSRYNVKTTVAKSENDDLALLNVEVPIALLPALKVAHTLPREGERIFVIGNPRGLAATTSEGIISAVRDFSDVGTMIQMTAAISPGSSGSPVLNMQGVVVGVAAANLEGGQSLNFVIPADRIEALVGPSSGISRAIGSTAVAGLSTDEKVRNEAGTTSKVETSADPLPDSTRARSLGLIRRAANALLRNNLTRALALAVEAVSVDPSYSTGWLLLGVLRYDHEDYRGAIEALARGIKIGAGNKALYFANNTLGDAYIHLGQNGLAIGSFKKAVAIDSTRADAYERIADACFNLGRYEEAADYYKQAIRVVPNNAEFHLGLGDTYINLKQPTYALEEYKIALKLNPDDANAHRALGSAYIEVGKFDEALGASLLATQLNPRDAENFAELGRAYESLKHYKQAIAAYRQAILLDSKFAAAYRNLGIVYNTVGNKRAALTIYKKLKTLNPDEAENLFSAIYK